ncbi:putative sensory transduction regulator [Humibacillus xanthopallidus]|uniref:Putative sensory transduction regulator n=1 Tax=Humibacillus xanthopallidus TaxID=412689 RepID=A0A543PQN3_9MICO|nr:YbjN domain-containing protein [Humibacillus xanthopallidus]TQN46383.1 putative sensory transduction regulator [Humibacillus xanthopallidus]
MTADETPAPEDAAGGRAPAAEARLTAYLGSVGLEWELGGRPGEYVVTLPGEKKLKTVVSLLVRDRTTSLSAFVIRNPDENHEAFYRSLLRRNLRLQGVAYAIDTDGDVYLRGELPTTALDEEHLDQLLGVVLTASDGAFNELLALGFLGSMKKEWSWRVSRGESTRNLDAFRHLLEDTSQG